MITIIMILLIKITILLKIIIIVQIISSREKPLLNSRPGQKILHVIMSRYSARPTYKMNTNRYSLGMINCQPEWWMPLSWEGDRGCMVQPAGGLFRRTEWPYGKQEGCIHTERSGSGSVWGTCNMTGTRRSTSSCGHKVAPSFLPPATVDLVRISQRSQSCDWRWGARSSPGRDSYRPSSYWKSWSIRGRYVPLITARRVSLVRSSNGTRKRSRVSLQIPTASQSLCPHCIFRTCYNYHDDPTLIPDHTLLIQGTWTIGDTRWTQDQLMPAHK